jgi:hypothetical protein
MKGGKFKKRANKRRFATLVAAAFSVLIFLSSFAAEQTQFKQPATLQELLALPPDQLEKVDIAVTRCHQFQECHRSIIKSFRKTSEFRELVECLEMNSPLPGLFFRQRFSKLWRWRTWVFPIPGWVHCDNSRWRRKNLITYNQLRR